MADAGTPMHVIVELDIDFELSAARADTLTPDVTQQSAVRRPLRGVVLKKETWATMSVITNSKEKILLKNSSVDTAARSSTNYTSNFILTGVSEQRSEKFQTISTFGATYGFFFGEQPRIMNFSAVLLNTADFQWELEWWTNYDEVLRGTQLADKRARVFLYFDEQIVEGYLVSASTQKNAQAPSEIPLNFQMWVTNVTHTVIAGDNVVPSMDETDAEFVDTASLSPALQLNNMIKAEDGSKVGLLSRLRASITAMEVSVGKDLGELKDFLYGRNLVLPAGYAGSDRLAGSPAGATFPGISTGSTSFLVKQVRTSGVFSSLADSTFWSNEDEYPRRTSDQARLHSGGGRLLGAAGTNLDTRPRMSTEESSLRAATQLADNLGRNQFGTTYMSQDQASQLLRDSVSVAFRVASYLAASSGVVDAVDNVTEGSVTYEVENYGDEAAAGG